MRLEMTPEEFAEFIEKIRSQEDFSTGDVEDMDEEELNAQMI